MKLLSRDRVLVGRFVIRIVNGWDFTREQLRILNRREQDAICLVQQKVLKGIWVVEELIP